MHVRPQFTVLIADGEDSSRARLEIVLREEGYSVCSAGDGQGAWDVAREAHPDAAVLEVKLNRMTGIELCRRFRADSRTSYLPVIILSDLPPEEYRSVCLENGATEFLTKPLERTKLLEALRTVLASRALSAGDGA